ncbi:hypothetical protein EIP86_002635 [Pleurotus ostreatoroseus]|nr:hypothetical protein EIP86_002635 [Pleurotus ostreatoroseus]
MLRTVYGRQGKGASDEKITRGIREFIHRVVSAALPGSYLVDIFPWLMCAPAVLARWKQYGQRWFLHDSQMFESLLTSVREKMTVDGPVSCIAETLVDESSKYNLTVEESSWLAGTML